MDLTKCHGVAVSVNPVCGLNVVGEWYSHKAIDNFVEKKQSRATDRLCSRVCQPNGANNDVILVVLAYTGLPVFGPFPACLCFLWYWGPMLMKHIPAGVGPGTGKLLLGFGGLCFDVAF